MEEPANCTFKPLNTPPVPPAVLVAPAEFTWLAPDNTPSDAEEGPWERLVDTLRSNWPALARCRSASASFGS